MTVARYTGYLRRDKATGAIVGEIKDAWGWPIALTATPADGGGYTLEGVLGQVPAALRVAGIDDAP